MSRARCAHARCISRPVDFALRHSMSTPPGIDSCSSVSLWYRAPVVEGDSGSLSVGAFLSLGIRAGMCWVVLEHCVPDCWSMCTEARSRSSTPACTSTSWSRGSKCPHLRYHPTRYRRSNAFLMRAFRGIEGDSGVSRPFGIEGEIRAGMLEVRSSEVGARGAPRGFESGSDARPEGLSPGQFPDEEVSARATRSGGDVSKRSWLCRCSEACAPS